MLDKHCRSSELIFSLYNGTPLSDHHESRAKVVTKDGHLHETITGMVSATSRIHNNAI